MNLRRILLPAVVLSLFSLPLMAAECPQLLQGELPKLRDKNKEQINLCEHFAGKPLLVVNTASHCGFAPQFKGLETLYKSHKDQGLEVLGVPSDDFNQEDADLAETAKVCYVNYGVTFTMVEPQHVTGEQAIPLFKDLAEQSSAPRWNFYKYVIDRQGKVVASFSSLTKPDDAALQAALAKAIASQPQ